MPGRARGLTLLELMIGLAVVAVVLAAGVPNFRDIVRNNRSTAQANDLIIAFNLARSEAIRRGQRVSVCPNANANGTQCGSNWNAGWMVFVDGAANESAGPAVVSAVQRWEAPGGSPTFSCGPEWVRYLPQGGVHIQVAAGCGDGAMGAGLEWDRIMTLTPSGCAREQAREIAFRAGGRVAARRASC